MKMKSSSNVKLNLSMILVLLLMPGMLLAQITKTPWQMIHPAQPSVVTNGWQGGAGYNQHGYAGDVGTNGLPDESTGAYQNASIPDINDAGWVAAPNGESIAFGSGSASILDNYGYSCWEAVDYNYFQTIVNVPENTVVTQFNIVFSSTDDGARVTLFNDDNPNGVVIAGSYFTINTGGTADLASYVTAGQNRVVVTQVDDCPTGNNLSSAQVVLNGNTVETCSIGDEQTFTILGANGVQGDIDPYSQSLPAGFTEWQPVYLTGSHPWGYIAGTNSWVNYSPDNTVGLNTRTPYRIRFEVPEDYSDPSMIFEIKADNRAVLWINDTYIDSIDGGGTSTPSDLVVSQALHSGVNEIRLDMVDWGGIVGFNYRIDVTMTSCENITEAVLTPAEAAALNNAPVSFAGNDQIIDCVAGATTVNLSGSGSSDEDGNLLTYSWSLNGTEVSANENYSPNLGAGTYNYTLTVSDGEATASDDVSVTVIADVTPPTLALSGDNPANMALYSPYIEAGYTATDVCDTDVAVSVSGTVDHETPGSYTLTYTATDDAGNTTQATREVTVINAAPVADAGTDQLVESLSGSEDVTLDGSGSSDPDGDNLSYSWVLNGSEVSQDASFVTSLTTGVHTFSLTVNDVWGETAVDVIVVSIVDPLVAYWKAEGNGDDETVNNNNVVSAGSGPVAYGTGADDQAFCFTGTNWMEIPDNPSLNIGSGDMAIVLWAKLSEANGIETLLDKRDPNNGFKGYVVYTIDNGFVGAQVNTGNNYLNWIAPINIADNQWHHIVFTIDRDNPTGGYITVDATQTYVFDPTAFVGDVTNVAPLRIGGRNDGIENWVGCIDDVRLYNYAFTPAEILDDFDNVTPPTNEEPVADAGLDQTEACRSVFNLDGSGSTDDGVLSYSWMRDNNLLVNGSFEDGMTGWTHTGVSGLGGNSIDLGSWGNATDGSWIIDLVGTGDYATPGHVEQTISTEIGGKYELSFDVIVFGAPSVVVTIDGGAAQTFSASGSHTATFTATATSTTIRLSSDGSYQYIGNNLFLDNVSIDGEVSTSASFTTTTLTTGSYTYTLTVTDAFGETNSDDVIVTVEADVEAPTLTLNGSNPASVNTNNPYSDGGASAYTAADNCDTYVQVDVSGTVNTGTAGSYTITYTATDDAGNSTQATRTVNVINTPPLAVAGIDQSIDCVVSTVDVTLDGSGSSDPDGDDLTYSWMLNGSPAGSSASISPNLGAGTHTFTLTVSDGIETSNDDVVVTVVADTEAPTIALLGTGPFSVNIHNTYTDAGYETADACGSEVTVEVTGSVDVETPGSYTLIFTATDAAGNVATAERIVTVINAAPIADAGDDQLFECVVGGVNVDLDGSGSSDADGDALSYSWSLDGNIVGTSAVLSTSHTAGDYTYTLTASDGIDTSSDDVIVTVIDDTEPPVITLLGDNPMDLGLYLAYVEAGLETVDACGSEVTVEISGSVDINTPGSYSLTYTATDENGNASSEDRVVEVFNTAPEVANAIEDVVLSFGDALLGADIDLALVFADVDTNDVLSYAFTSSNAAAADVSLSGSMLSMSAIDLGVSVVELTATDNWGASVTHSFSIVVNVTSDLAGALLFAHSEIKIKKDVEIFSGNILVNDAYSSHGNHDDDEDDDDEDDDDDDDHGNSHDHGHYQIKMDKDSYVAPGYALMADRIEIKQGNLIESDVYTNDLNNSGDITGVIFDEVATPLFSTLPPFKTGTAGTSNITVNKNQEVVLEPGDYKKIVVKDRGTLTFTGGVYNIEKLEAKKYSHVRFNERTEVRVEDEIKFAKSVYVGPAGGSYIDASDIIFYVAGDHHAAKLEQRVEFYGTIYAESGEIDLKKDITFTGALLSDEIEIDKDCDLTVHSYFSTDGAGLAKGGRVAWIEPEMEAELPLVSDLSGNYPNPFNPSTSIDFALADAGDVSLKIYDIRGAEVAVVASGFHEAGHYSVHFTPENMSSGTYLYVLDTGSFREVKRMVYLK